MPINFEERSNKFNEQGEEEVSRQLAQGLYGEKKVPLVREWLKTQERKRDDARYEKHVLIARSAKNAAWVAAIAAIIATVWAIVA